MVRAAPETYDDANPNRTNYPSSFPNSNIIAVAATDNRDRRASFSNYGTEMVDLAAPGVDIMSTLPDTCTWCSYWYNSGTSMATPHVTGVAALLKSQYPNIGDGQMKSIILDSVDKKTTLSGKVLSGGRLNVVKAIR